MKLIDVYQDALKNNYAIGAFNFSNMETLQGICDASQKANMPVIVSVSESALKYMGDNMLTAMVASAKQTYNIPIFLHLDHGKDFDICKKCVDLGFDSVMIDGSSKSFEENISLTKQVCEYAHKFNVQVEGELGVLAGVEDDVVNSHSLFTDPIQAKQFIEQTKVDSLAIAIGTSHGAYKFSGEAKIRIDILSQIENLIPNFPFVLHGASSVPHQLVEKFNQFGGSLEFAKGVPENILHEVSTKHNIVKINVDTDIRIATTAEIRKNLLEDTKLFDMRKYLGNARNEVEKIIENKINLFKL